MVMHTPSFYNGYFGDCSSFGRKKLLDGKGPLALTFSKIRLDIICVVQKRKKCNERLALDSFSPPSLELVKEQIRGKSVTETLMCATGQQIFPRPMI